MAPKKEKQVAIPATVERPTMTLYEAVEALGVVNSWIDEHADAILAAGGEMPEELAALLDKAEGDLTTKVERVALKIRQLDALADAIAAEAKRLAARAKSRQTAAAALKKYLVFQMDAAGVPRVEAPLVTVNVQSTAPRLAMPNVETALAVEAFAPFVVDVPEQVVVTPAHKTIDQPRLLAALLAGEVAPVEGVAAPYRTRHARLY